MLCYRAFSFAGDSIEQRSHFTKSTGCKAVLHMKFWGVIDISRRKIKSLVTEIIFPSKAPHNHSLDEFSIPATDTYPKLRLFIESCVEKGMGHHNTFVQVRKYARDKLIPEVERGIGKKISHGDTRFYPTRNTVYIY